MNDISFLETANGNEEEFGLARLEQSVVAHATECLPEICEALMHAVSDLGEQRDDRTLIVRIAGNVHTVTVTPDAPVENSTFSSLRPVVGLKPPPPLLIARSPLVRKV